MTEERKPYKINGRPSTIYRVVKNKDNPYVMIDRRPVDNPKLSFKAKGILTYLLSRPDGWEVSVSDLIKHGAEGEAAIRSGLKELKEAGHMRYTQSRNQGRITGWLIEVFEVPISPDGDFQDVEKQDVENRGQVLKKLIKKQKPISKKAAAKPHEPTPPEVLLFRSVTSRFPPKVNFDDVVKSVQKVTQRLGRAATRDDLLVFYKKWTGLGYKPINLAWLEWAESGQIPQDGRWKPQKYQEPRAFEGIRQFLQVQEAVNGVTD